MTGPALKKLTRVENIIIHCAATPPSMDIGAREIDQWHRQRGFVKIGYHYVIRRDGRIEAGRAPNEVGAHAQGFNSNSIGVCLVGGVDANNRPEPNFTPEQWATLSRLVGDLRMQHPDASVIGHRSVDKGKACPSFDVREWYEKGVVIR